MPIRIASVLALIFALAATILLFVFVLPKRKDKSLPPFLQMLHNIFHFKKLYLELILKALYTFSTALCIFLGFFLLFSRTEFYSYGLFSSNSYSESTALQGLLILIFGPILLRIVYEFALLLILVTKNLMEINRKLGPVALSIANEAVPEPRFLYCTQCGTRYDVNRGKCPICGKE